MDSSALFNNQKGVTYLELIVIVAVLTLILFAATPSFNNFYQRYQMRANFDDLVNTIRLAQAKSMGGQTDDTFGIHFISGTGGSFTLFKGASYATRDTNFDEVHTLPGSLSLAETIAGDDVVFLKVEGSTTDLGTVTISWPDGGISRTLDINEAGRVDET